MAKKAIHKIVRYSLLILALVVAGLLIAPFFIDVNDYKSRFEQEVENATGRQLSIGEVHASLFPWVGVRLEDLHLANREGFSSHDFLSVKRLHIKLALLPLLNRELEIKKFEIEAPKVFLERHRDGQSNWQDFMPSSEHPEVSTARMDKGTTSDKASDGDKSPMLAALTAESLQISGGELTWLDEKTGKPVSVSGINLTMDDVQLDHPFPVALSASVRGSEVHINTQIGPLGDLSRLDVQKLPVQGEIGVERLRVSDFSDYISDSWPASLGEITKATATVNIRLEQHPDGVRISEGEALLAAAHELAVSWKLNQPKENRVELRRASLTIDGKGVFDGKGRVQGLPDKPRFQIRFSTPELTRNWLAGVIPELTSLYAGNPAAWKHVKLSGLLAGDARHLDIRDLQLSLNGELVQVSGAVIYQRPDIRLRVTTGKLNLDPWLPRAAKASNDAATAAAGSRPRADNQAMAEPDLRFLKPWRVTARVQADGLLLHGLNMKNFQMNVTGNNGVFDLNPMRFNLSGGLVEEKASLNVATYPARWKESVHVTGVRLEPVLKPMLDMDMLEGTLAMDTSFKARGLTGAALASLNGRGKLLLRDGKIRGFDIAGAIRRLTRPGSASGPQETEFAQLSGSFAVTNGVATNKDLFMASPLLRVTGHGVVNLVQKQLDYHVKPRVVGTLTGQGDRIKLRKGLTVPLHISGPFAAPKIRPEVNAKTLIENAPALLNKKGNLGGALGAILGGKDGGQGGKKPASQPNSVPPTKPQPATPEKQLQDAVGGLLRGL